MRTRALPASLATSDPSRFWEPPLAAPASVLTQTPGTDWEARFEAMTDDRQTISIRKACALVGVSRRTIYNWIANGKVEYVHAAGGSIRIFIDTLWRPPEGHGGEN